MFRNCTRLRQNNNNNKKKNHVEKQFLRPCRVNVVLRFINNSRNNKEIRCVCVFYFLASFLFLMSFSRFRNWQLLPFLFLFLFDVFSLHTRMCAVSFSVQILSFALLLDYFSVLFWLSQNAKPYGYWPRSENNSVCFNSVQCICSSPVYNVDH